MISTPTRACVESLESRCLMSVVTPAIQRPHPSPANILGAIFLGSYSTTAGQTGSLSIDVTSESKSGKIAGTLALTVVGSPFTLLFKGTVNPKWDISFHGSSGHKIFSAKGLVSSNLDQVFGEFNFNSKHSSAHGSFSATAETPT